MSIEKHVLDAMVQEQDVDRKYWEQLLSEPDADELWFAAVERRQQIDRFTKLVSVAPLIASGLQSVRRLMQNLAETAGRITVTGQPPQFDELNSYLSASDGGAVSEDASREIEVQWNNECIEELPPGLRLSFNSETLKCWHYQIAGSEGWLEQNDTWDVVAEDGPVILIFFDHEVSTLSISDALATESNRAIVTIIPSS
jgi:hypothetical protein